MVYLIFRTLLKRDSSLLEKFIQVYMQHTFYSWFGPSRPLKKHIGFIGEGKKSPKWCRKSSIIGYNWDSRSSSRETRNKLAKPFFRRCAFKQRPMLSDLNGFDKLQIFPIDKNTNFNCSHYNLVLVVKSDNLQFVSPKSIRNYKKNNAWNIRRLVICPSEPANQRIIL